MPVLAALMLHLIAFQEPLHPSSLPVQARVTIVQVVAGDAYQGRDYETVITIESAAGGSVTLGSTAFVKDRAGVRRWLSVQRTVLADDLRGGRTLILGYDTDDAERFPGTTAVGPSRIVVDKLRRTGQATMTVRNYASRPDNTGAIRLVERRPVAFPLLLNGLPGSCSGIPRPRTVARGGWHAPVGVLVPRPPGSAAHGEWARVECELSLKQLTLHDACHAPAQSCSCGRDARGGRRDIRCG
jgi:hypothetical protein